MKRLEAEDSKYAAELAEEYRKQGIDVRSIDHPLCFAGDG